STSRRGGDPVVRQARCRRLITPIGLRGTCGTGRRSPNPSLRPFGLRGTPAGREPFAARLASERSVGSARERQHFRHWDREEASRGVRGYLALTGESERAIWGGLRPLVGATPPHASGTFRSRHWVHATTANSSYCAGSRNDQERWHTYWVLLPGQS